MKFNYNGIYNYAFASLVFFIPLSAAIPNIVLLLITLLFLFKLNREDLFILKNRCTQLLLLIISLIVLNSLVSNSIVEDLNLLSRLALICLIQIIAFKVTNFHMSKIGFFISVNIIVLISIISIIIFFLKTGSFVFGNTSSVSEVLILERPYLGFLCLLNVLISFQLMNYYSTMLLKIVFFSSSVISILLIITISARISLISLFVVLFIRFFYFKKKEFNKRILFFTIFMISMLGILLVVFTNKNLSERFFIEDTYEKSLKKMAVYEPRIVIWSCAKNVIATDDYNLFLGFQGFKKTKNKLIECYSSDIKNESKKNYFLNEKFNTHNQFIDFFLSHGIFLMLLLFLLFANSILININRFYHVSIIIVFVLFFLVENVLHRQLGCYVLGVFLNLYFSDKNISKDKIIPNI